MAKPKKLAFVNGRRVLVDYDTHIRKDNDQQYNKSRRMNDSSYLAFYKGSLWRKTREQVLMRDNYMCQRCGLDATLVDHIIPSKDDWDDRLNPDNLQSLCKSCHYLKTKSENTKRDKGVNRPMRITLVAGYPGSGKTEYVKQHLTEHDLIYNYDELMHASTGLPKYQGNVDVYDYIQLILDMMLRKLKSEVTFNQVWLVMTIPDARIDTLLVNHELRHVRLKTSRQDCLKRLTQDDRDVNALTQVMNRVDDATHEGLFDKFELI
ncbi:MAG: HNH endonuclease [Lactobacillus sp.]|jgi:hypothetical protein|nr:HNH endonuclease [Lactobacillus sp.]